MCGNIEWHANGLANASQTPNQYSRAPMEKDGNPLEVGLAVRRRNDSLGSSLCVRSHASLHVPDSNDIA